MIAKQVHTCIYIDMGQSIQEWTKWNLWKTAFKKFEVIWSASDMVCLNRPYHFKFFKGCLPQIPLGPFLNTLSHIYINFEVLSFRDVFSTCQTSLVVLFV